VSTRVVAIVTACVGVIISGGNVGAARFAELMAPLRDAG